MKKYLRYLAMSAIGVLVIVGVAAVALAKYYGDHFSVNTWINGIYCTGKTVDEVNSELQQNYKASVMTITDANRAYWEIDMNEAGILPQYKESLYQILENYHRTGQMQDDIEVWLQPDYFSYESEKLMVCLKETSLVREEEAIPYGVAIQRDNGVYSLYDGNVNRLDVDVVYQALVTALDKGGTEISLGEVPCYKSVEDTKADKIQRDIWDKLNSFADCKIVYDMGAERIPITPELVMSFLKQEVPKPVQSNGEWAGSKKIQFLLDEKGNFIVDETAVSAWVDELLSKYNTSNSTRDFQATRGDIVKVSYIKYGTELDGNAEKAYLMKALTTEHTEMTLHVPTYIQQGFVRGLDDVGDTYIEIDMTEQKMYYYKNGEVLLQTDVVTGDVQDDMETPEGINYVYNKQRNRTLRGPGYTAFVKYWMPVIGGVGIHDAGWRSKFGGEIYKKNGSHGCINTPSEIMDDFYEAVEVGTPVIMFY